MELSGFYLALAVGAITVVLFMRSKRMLAEAASQNADLEQRISREELRASLAESATEKVMSDVARLEKELAAAVARRDEKAMAAALWNLELERTYRQWRDVVVPSDSSRDGSVNDGQKLTFALSQEVERLREEVGVAIRFDGALDLPLDADIALGALRICEETLALAAKACDEVVVSVDQGEEPSLTVVMQCSGWEGDQATETQSSLKEMAKRLEGFLAWDVNKDDNATVRLRLPSTTGSTAKLIDV